MALGDIFEIGSAIAGVKGGTDVLYLDDGSYIVAFSNQDGGDNDILIQRHAADGTVLLGPIEVGSADPIQKFTPILSLNDNGTFVVTYDGNGSDARSYVYDTDLVLQDSELHLNGPGTSVVFVSNVTTHPMPDGGYVAFWYERWTDASNDYTSLMAERVDEFGNVPVSGDGSPRQIYTLLTSGSTSFDLDSFPEVSENPDGTLRVFLEVETGTPTYSIRSIEVDPDGNLSGSSIVFNYTTGSGPITNLQTLQNDEGDYFLIFDQGGNTHYSNETSAAALGGTNFLALLTNAEAALAPDGKVYLAGWEDQGSSYNLVIKELDYDADAGFSTLDTVVTVATGFASAGTNPQIAVADNGDVTVQWNDGDDVFARTFSEDAVPTGLPQIVGFRSAYESLSVDMSGVIDPYGIDESTLEYTWFINGLPAGGNGENFFTDFSHIGQEISVLVTYESDAGFQEFLVSDETAALTEFTDLASLAIPTGRMAVGETLSVDLTNLDETNFGYSMIWFADGGVVQVGGETLDLTAAMLGQEIDLLVRIEGGGLSIDGPGGTDILVEMGDGAAVDWDGVTISGGNADDVISGSIGADLLSGKGGNDSMEGGDGKDKIYGLGGDDLLFGGDDDDILSGSYGLDMLFGGDGEDQLLGGQGADFIDGGEGIDLIKFTASQGGVYVDLEAGEGFAGEADGDVYVSIENVNGTGAADFIVGTSDDNRLKGGSGDDQLFGGAGADRLYGENGADVVVGGDGANLLFGGNDEDQIIGGQNRDAMTGGAGADNFVFGDGAYNPLEVSASATYDSTGLDRINDFENGIDTLVFVDSTVSAMGDLTITATGNNSFVDYDNGRIVVVGSATAGVSDLDVTDFMFL